MMFLTEQGEAKLKEMTQRFRELAAQIASAFALQELWVSVQTVGKLRK